MGLRLIGALLAVLLLAAVAEAITVKTLALQTAATANGNGTDIDIKGFTTTVIQVAGTFTATVNFEASVDGLNWFSKECFSEANRMTSATSATAASGWRCNLIGLNRLRARISGYGSGTVTVTAGLASAGVS